MFGIPVWVLFSVFGAVFVFSIWKILSRNEVDLTSPNTLTSIQDDEDYEFDEEFIAEIQSIKDESDLMDEVEYYDFKGKTADALVKKALELKNDLTPNNWVDIYDAIEDSGRARETARKMAGDALQDEDRVVSQ